MQLYMTSAWKKKWKYSLKVSTDISELRRNPGVRYIIRKIKHINLRVAQNLRIISEGTMPQ